MSNVAALRPMHDVSGLRVMANVANGGGLAFMGIKALVGPSYDIGDNFAAVQHQFNKSGTLAALSFVSAGLQVVAASGEFANGNVMKGACHAMAGAASGVAAAGALTGNTTMQLVGTVGSFGMGIAAAIVDN